MIQSTVMEETSLIQRFLTVDGRDNNFVTVDIR